MGGSRAGGKRKKRRTHAKDQDLDLIEASKRPPKSFVFSNGEVPKEGRALVEDLKQVMEPNTASSLKTRKRNVLKDFVQIAGPLGVTHLIPVGTGTRNSLNIRMVRLPRGPTMTFRVTHFASCSDVAATQRRPVSVPDAYLNSPLVILNNFASGSSPHVKLMAVMLQNMFPAINVSEVNLAGCRRVVLFHMDKQSGEIEFRHFFIRTKGVGHTKHIKRVLKRKKDIDLSHLEDIADMMDDEGYATSDSEGEDNEDSHVTIPQDTKRGRRPATRKSAVRLQELGPRFRLRLIKIEDGVFDGDVIHHAYVQKTPEEAAKLRMLRKQREKEKDKRRAEQAANVERKRQKREARGTRSTRGQASANAKEEEPDDDEEWYKKEVGSDSDQAE